MRNLFRAGMADYSNGSAPPRPGPGRASVFVDVVACSCRSRARLASRLAGGGGFGSVPASGQTRRPDSGDVCRHARHALAARPPRQRAGVRSPRYRVADKAEWTGVAHSAASGLLAPAANPTHSSSSVPPGPDRNQAGHEVLVGDAGAVKGANPATRPRCTGDTATATSLRTTPSDVCPDPRKSGSTAWKLLGPESRSDFVPRRQSDAVPDRYAGSWTLGEAASGSAFEWRGLGRGK